MTTHAHPAAGAPLVALRPLRASDADRVRSWMGSPHVWPWTVLVPGPEYAMSGISTPEAVERYVDQLLHDRRRITFAITLGGQHVGNVGLKEFSDASPDCECFIEIGDPSLRGRGTGRAAMGLLLEHAFHVLQLRTIRLSVFDFNKPAIRLYERLGFEHTGRVAWHWVDGVYHAVLGMELDHREWDRRQGRG